jgi:hypothetical protein
MEKRNNKNKKRLLILVALVGVMGIGGVVAATSITINSGTPLSLGAGYSTATTCDTDVTVAATQGYDANAALYKVTAFRVTGVDLTSTIPATGLGCGSTATPKVMQLAYVTGSAGSYTSVQASWTLPSSSMTTASFEFGATGNASNTTTGGVIYYYANSALTSFSISTLASVALSIA